MRISPKNIIHLQTLKGYGNVAVRAVITEMAKLATIDDNGLYELLEHMVMQKKLKTKVPSWDEFAKAGEHAENVIEFSSSLGISMLTCYDDKFPMLFSTTVNADGRSNVPLLIHYRGNIDVCDRSGLAVIGTREPTPSGMQASEYFAAEFASKGINIISGLALGCDTAAHRGALKVGGSTTAILAGGLDSVYPKENLSLSERILESGGLLMSENPIGTTTNKYNLVSRDRLQAGLANATLVIQTSINGGTMHAAKSTLASRKPLWVVEYKDTSDAKIQGNLLLKEMGAETMTSSVLRNNPQYFLDKLK